MLLLAGTNQKGKAFIYDYDDGTSSWTQIGFLLVLKDDNLGLGTGVAISRDGTTIAVGQSKNDTYGNNVGLVRVYTYSGTPNNWTQKGSDLPGGGVFSTTEQFGICVSLNGDGSVVAIGTRHSKVKIYQYVSSAWSVMGQASIDNLTPSGDSKFGMSIALSQTGYIAAIGAYSDDVNGTDNGSVQVIQWNAPYSVWSIVGSKLLGEDQTGDNRANYGACVDLSEDGTKLIVGSPGYDVTGSGSQGDGSYGSNDGKVYIYEYSNGSWNLFGNTLNRTDIGDRFGCGVAISNDGLKIASAYQGANDKGFVNYYEYNNGTSQWDLKQTLSGTSNGDFFGGNANDLNGINSSLMMSKDGLTLIVGSYIGTYVQVWEGQPPPTLTSVTIASNNSDTTKAKIGDTVTLTLTASETLSGNPTVVFTGASNSVTVTNTSGNTYTASYVVAENDTSGTLAFTIDFTSSGGVAGTQVTSITSGSNVTIDATKPTLTSVTIASNNSDTTKATTGDTVTLSLTSSETLSGNPTVVFTGANNSVTVTNTSGNNYTASYDVDENDTSGTLAFTIDFTDSIGNTGTQVTSITSGSNVTIFFATNGNGDNTTNIIIRKQKKKQKQRKKIQKLNLIRKLQYQEYQY